MNGLVAKAIAIWVLIAAGEILNGNVRFKWIKILEDFDIRKGNLLVVGMGLLFLCPTIIYLLT